MSNGDTTKEITHTSGDPLWFLLVTKLSTVRYLGHPHPVLFLWNPCPGVPCLRPVPYPASSPPVVPAARLDVETPGRRSSDLDSVGKVSRDSERRCKKSLSWG